MFSPAPGSPRGSRARSGEAARNLFDINKVRVCLSGITRFAIPAMKDSEKSRTDLPRLDTSHKLFGKRAPYSVLAEQK